MSEQIQQHILDIYEIVQKIGSGAYGIVWKVKQQRTGKIYALKKNFDAFANSTDAQRTYRQIMFLRQLDNPQVIHLYTIHRAYNNKDIYLVFEYVDVDLYTLSRDRTILTIQHKKYILYQVAKSLLYLHCCRIIHRDLKPSNVLVNQDCLIKLCDFGLVRSLEEKHSTEVVAMTDYIATRWYRAPQILFSVPYYSEAIDIWSFGCLMGQLMKGKAMFPGTSTHNQLQKVISWTGIPTNKQLKQFQPYISKQTILLFKPKTLINRKEYIPCQDKKFHSLLDATLKFSPNDRPTIQQIVTDQYFAEFYKNDIQEIQNVKKYRKKITVPVDDNKRLTVAQYRQLIYCEIAVNYNKEEETKDCKDVNKDIIRKKKSNVKYSTPVVQAPLMLLKNSPPTTVNSTSTNKNLQPSSIKDQTFPTTDNKVRRTKIYSADASFKVSRSNSLKKQPIHNLNTINSNSKKKKGISIYSKMKTEGQSSQGQNGHITRQINDRRVITSYTDKQVKIKVSKQNGNGDTISKSKERQEHPIRRCIEQATTKKIKRAVNINHAHKCYTESSEKYQW